MAYSLDKITTKADCDVVIAAVQKEKDNLTFTQTSLTHQKDNNSGNATDVDTELTAVSTELTGLTTIVGTLGAGKVKDGYLKKQAALTLRQLILNGKKASYGSSALVQTEFQLAQVALQITEAASLITSLQTKKAALTS
ncbi:hypothetical protein [Parasediminibacterium sp. JCM 36343]|uniref:hypothetical protein n=1 Tax=Parasediminibacterium sp. JCM 36343 TaxID=3374279 RepID=UPI00397D388F